VGPPEKKEKRGKRREKTAGRRKGSEPHFLKQTAATDICNVTYKLLFQGMPKKFISQ